MKRGIVAAALCLIASLSLAAGFDSRYKVRSGDFNSDSLVDLYVDAPGPTFIQVGDIPIFIPPGTRDFVLQNSGNGSFIAVSNLTTTQRITLSQWPIANVEVSTRDVNVDGRVDLEINGIGNIISGSFDQIVFANSTSGSAPLHITAQNLKFQNFHHDLVQAILDPNYFTNNAPLRVVSAEPGTRILSSSIPNVIDRVLLIAQAMDRCENRYTNAVCGMSFLDPPSNQCIQQGATIYDSRNQAVGTDTINVCLRDIHIYAYIPGSVTLQADTSVFDQDAMGAATNLAAINSYCPAVPTTEVAQLQGVLGSIYGTTIFGSLPFKSDVANNSIPHEPFPGDASFSPSDATFHHYDTETPICNTSAANCVVSIVNGPVGSLFTFPAKYLVPTVTARNGIERVEAHAALFGLDNPKNYWKSLGDVTQVILGTAPWNGATQNTAMSNHWMYPGKVARHVQVKNGYVQVLSHGIGINRAFCPYLANLRPVHVVLGLFNDTLGEKAFKTLDKEMKRYWDAVYGNGPAFSETACETVNECAVDVQ